MPVLDQIESLLRDVANQLPEMGLNGVRGFRVELEKLTSSLLAADLRDSSRVRLTRLRRDAGLGAALFEQACDFLRGSSGAVASLSSGYGANGMMCQTRNRAAINIEV